MQETASAAMGDVTMVGAVRLAAIHYEAGFRIDDFLAKLGEKLRADDIRLGGAIQRNVPGALTSCSAMTLIDLASGTATEISQNLGSQAQGCRLDTSRLAEFGMLLGGKSADDVDLLILNKFGKAEADGHGLRSNFVRAIEAGIPILTAVRPPYDQAWLGFHEGLAVELAADLELARAWCLSAVETRRAALLSAGPMERSKDLIQ